MESNQSPAASFNPADYYICFDWTIRFSYIQQPRKRSGRTTPKLMTSSMKLLGVDLASALYCFAEKFKKTKRQAKVDDIISVTADGIGFTFRLNEPSGQDRLTREQEATLELPASSLADVWAAIDYQYSIIKFPRTIKQQHEPE